MPYRTLISAAELRELRAGSAAAQVRIVDCRFWLDQPAKGLETYLQSHLPDAVYAHLDNDLAGPIEPGKTGRHPLPDPAQMATTLSLWGVGDQTQVVAYDQGGGPIAARLWWILNWLGHSSVAVLDGGFGAWVEAGGEVEESVPSPTPQSFAPRPNDSLLASAEEVDAGHFSCLVDSRERQRYLGEHEPIDPIAGHIPGAVNRPFGDNLANGRFKSAELLRSEFEALLPTDAPSTDAVFYCGSGVTAAHNLLAMARAGLDPARLYNGSWSEWIATKRPVATGEPDSQG